VSFDVVMQQKVEHVFMLFSNRWILSGSKQNEISSLKC